MTDALVDLELSSTARTSGQYDEWISNTGEPDRSPFVPLSNFDLAVHAKLRQIARLKRNWDAEGARPIDVEILAAAREFASGLPNDLKDSMDIPAVVPMARGPERDGNLQFEWDDGNRSLELEVEDPRTVHYLKWDSAKGVEEEDFFSIDNLDRAASLLRWYLGGVMHAGCFRARSASRRR